ncbi:TPA: hypothetical protein DCF80_02230 [Candidatus Saccharibacteria bacterium]|nr:hypothetical protein [Candidatus Saccharibacteria bacterium]
MKRFSKYIIVGIASFAVEYTSFALLLLLLPVSPTRILIAQTLSYILALLFNFVGTRKYTFSTQRKHFDRSTSSQLRRFTALALFNLFLSNVVIYVLVHGVSMDPLVAKAIVMSLIICWNYLIFNKLIFSAK